jgi:hypothetical protein
MVEFALVAPFFFLILVIIVQGGLYLQAQATIDNVTREAARAVAICGTSSTPFLYQKDATGKWMTYQSCLAAANYQAHHFTLPVSFQPNSDLSLLVCHGSGIPASGHCTANTPYSGPTYVGEAIEVDISFNYRYYVDPLMGSSAPTTTISSSARVVAQQ